MNNTGKLSKFLWLFFLAFSLPLSAQNTLQVIGTIVDSSDSPLIGASVSVKNSTKGSISDMDGNFALELPSNATLVVKYMGFATQEVKVAGQKALRIVLEEDSKMLNEVTVTALGIKREKKSLGYAIGEVKGDELIKAKETNVINALAGKVPGLIISQTAGGPAGSARVLIRGNTELSGNNEPLYVVDGVPLDNTNFGSADTYGGYDLGDGISNINPDDIENISVLKGPAASALYGSRASHGVILITTKKAGGKKKLGIELNSTTTFDRQLTQYDVQSTYGQGSDGRIGTNDLVATSSNWGPKLDSGLFLDCFDGVRRPYQFIENNINGFFRTGVTTTNTLILNSVQNNTGLRLSYTNLLNEDIVPNTGMSRNTVNLRATSKFLNRLDLDVKMNYVREDVKNRPALSGSGYNIGKNLMTLATTFDQEWLKSYANEKGEYNDWNGYDQYHLNPYWVIYAMENTSVKDRFSGSSSVNYKINEKFNVRVNGGGEINVFEFMNYAPYSTPGSDETGSLEKRFAKNYTYNVELMAGYKDKFGLFDLGANAGGNIFYVNNVTNTISAQENIMRNSTALQSFLTKETDESSYRKQINSVFGMINLAYNDFLYLDATIRTDKSSTLPADNNVYTYPSVSGSFLFSELLPSMNKLLSYGKLRVSAAQVGSDTNPYQLHLNYNAPDKPYGNIPYATVDNRMYATDDRARVPNKNLKPTRTNSVELGADFKFFQNRIGLELTYYTQNSKDQILYLPISNATSFNEKLVNAGNIENKGLEISLTTIPVETKDFTWNLDFNFAKNSNQVVALAAGLNRFALAKAQYLDVTINALEGANYGAIMSSKQFERNENGDLIIDANTGFPVVSNNTDAKILGNAMWDWTGGISTALHYKNFVLSSIIDVKVGADLYSMTARTLYTTGKSKATLEGRDGWYMSEEQRLEAGVVENQWTPSGGLLVEGVVQTTDAGGNVTWSPNTRYVDPQEYWNYVGTNDPSFFIFDNSYVKVREITFGYTLPKKWIGKFADDISLSFVARNPFIIWKNIPNVDPDSNYNNGTGMGLEWGSLPSRKSFGFNLNVKF
ncbi:MAG: SusC/RagA family TonB-linked outer membrane protein [Candidatus Symbiothrix sp.]|jgi:TonB-linked SusC/RagA family outer membrane protein|nr:SusC/RagA family TonB-linked outer membrane protein [Candidatus Symbiothrix sp.]